MFETPLFLIAAGLGALIPLILHLMQRKRSTPLKFPTLRFLKLAQKASSRRIRIEHLLLWLLRTLIMVLLGVAFAMPMLRAQGLRFLAQAPRDVAIVVDISYSMGYHAGRETIWNRAVELATGLIEDLSEQDRYCIYLAAYDPIALVAEPISDKTPGPAQLNAHTLAYGTSRLGPAIEMAYEALQRVTQRRQRELHIITDNQALPWTSMGTATAHGAESDAVEEKEENGDEGKLSDVRIGDETTVFVTLLGVDTPENATPRSIELAPRMLFEGSGGRLRVALGYSGPSRDTTVSLYINDEETARRSVVLGTPRGEVVTFTIPPLQAGTHFARVETTVDNLPLDDAFYFLIHVRDQLPVMVVGSERDTFFLRAALRAAGGGSTSYTWLQVDELADATFSEYSTIFLCNALPVPGQVMASLERYVDRGGLLAVFPGTRASISDYAAWRCLPGTPFEVRELSRLESRQARNLIWTDHQHPVLQGLDSALTTPSVALQRRLTWSELAEDTRVLISLGPERPFLLERSFGQGTVLMFSVGAERAWSNFPLTPFYLPIAFQIIEYSGGMGSYPLYLTGEAQIPVASFLPDAQSGVRIVHQDGTPVSIRSTLLDGRTIIRAENMQRSGIYMQQESDRRRPVAAVNLDRIESDLTPLDIDRVPELLGAAHVYVATDREELNRLLHEHRVGRTYGELLLWIVLFLIACEFVYANRLARAKGQLSDDLKVAPSGRMAGHAGHSSRGTA